MADGREYVKWTKESLVKKIKRLEDELKQRDAAAAAAVNEGAAASPNDPGTVESTKKKEPASSEVKRSPLKKMKKSKTVDPSNYSRRFIALKFAYLGKRYNGLEYQSTGSMATVEEELWKALVKACLIFPEHPDEVNWGCCEYSKCGRTDRGVSAFGQVIGLRVRSNKPTAKKRKPARTAAGGEEAAASDEEARGEDAQEPEEEPAPGEDDTPLPPAEEIPYCRVLNRILPPDIKVYAWCPNPPPDFSARFSCRERQYRYFFTQPAFAPIPTVLEPSRREGAPKDGWLDIEAMRKAAKMFEGLHDFRNFCKIDPSKQVSNFTRKIFECDIVEVKDVESSIPFLSGEQFRDPSMVGGVHPKVYYFHVRGSAFLWHQIRHMVAVIFLVGQGLEPASVVQELLDAKKFPGRPDYILADDQPLVLWNCLFGRECEDGAEDNMDWVYAGEDHPMGLHGSWGLTNDLWQYWREKKMEEILANRMMDWISVQANMERVPNMEGIKPMTSARVFEGGNSPKYTGRYIPVLKKKPLASPEEVNDRWAQRKGFKNAEEMVGLGNWRDAIKAREAAKNGVVDGAADADADE